MPNQHHILDSKKQQIEASLGGLFADVDQAIAAAMHCLTGKDAAQCQALIQGDIRLNDKRRLIEQDCLVAIASQQPVAHDLRDLVADMHIAAELERMGDHARDIAANVLDLNGLTRDTTGQEDILTMAAMCREMLAEVARAHRDGDVAGARRAAGRNRELGAQRKQVVDTLLSVMRSEWTLVENGTRLLWMVHSLERCGDRVTNIAEQVVFRVTGETVELA